MVTIIKGIKMKRFTTILAALFLIFTFNGLYAQEEEKKEEEKIEETEEEPEIKFDDEDEEEWDNMVFGEWKFDKHSKRSTIEKRAPIINLKYGFSQPVYYDDLLGGFAMINSVELNIGYSNLYRLEPDKSVTEGDFNYLFLNNALSDIGISGDDGDIETNTWKFGLTNGSGYGWLLGEKSNILLFHAGGIGWSQTEFDPDQPDSTYAGQKFNDYDNFRFSDHFSGGINIRLLENISINAEYGRTVVYQRHLFWYWTLSKLIHGAGNGLLDVFVNKVEESSPHLVPVVNFVLKNGLAYGFYELQKEKMNWPLNSAHPLMFDTYQIGLTFTF